MAYCGKCLHLDVCKTAETCDGHVPRCKHFMDKERYTAQKWIPVTERLPEKNGIYLTFNKKKEYGFHFFQTGKIMWPAVWDEDEVTHWMPLPEPPKEGETE